MSSSSWNHNTLSLQYKLDNEFELVFVVAYQNILKLTYIDKFLSEIALRFRDKYKQEIESRAYNSKHFADFGEDFDEVLGRCEREAERRDQTERRPRRFEESSKANKTVGSMIETKKTGGILGSIVNTMTGGGPAETTEKKPSKNNNNKTTPVVVNGDKDDAENSAAVSNEDENGFEDFEKKPAARVMKKFEPKSKGYFNLKTLVLKNFFFSISQYRC